MDAGVQVDGFAAIQACQESAVCASQALVVGQVVEWRLVGQLLQRLPLIPNLVQLQYCLFT